MSNNSDAAFMQRALALATAQLGRTSPNPSVGCVVVRDGEVIAEGATADGGRPHAEAVALEKAAGDLSSATLYVTLEPCCHQGKSGPCTDLIIKSGIKRVVVATKDPYQEVAGKGIEALKECGIDVVEGIEKEAAARINQGFFKVQTHHRPWVTLKVATSLDGKIATKTGDSQWITNKEARAYGHHLRATHDAILVGIGTVLADDPLLTCRLDEECQQPIRIVLDTKLRLPETSQLVKTAKEVPVWVMSEKPSDTFPAEVITVPLQGKHIALKTMLEELAKRGITRLLIEGGSHVATNFLKAGLVDQLVWCRAPLLIGNDGIPAFQSLETQTLKEALSMSLISHEMKGDNVIETYLFSS